MDDEKKILVKCTLQYTSYERCGAILENTGCDKELLGIIRKSLNGITEYKLPLSASVLPTKQNWKIYEPTRNKKLFTDAVLAAAEQLDIKAVYIEKDYWITRSLKLMAQDSNAERAIFKGGTSLPKPTKLVTDFLKI